MFQQHHTTGKTEKQDQVGPSGSLPAYIKDGLICVAGRHLARVGAGTLWRTFNSKRELLAGALLFRVDVLDVAQQAGARRIVATDRETGRKWEISLKAFRERGFPYYHRAFGAQIGLNLEYWELPEQDSGGPTQLGLWR